jgi:hypothetical protein
MARLRNDSGRDLVLFGPVGHPDAFHVAEGAIVEIPGDAVLGKGLEGDPDVEEPNGIPTDAFQIGTGDDARIFSTEMWSITRAEAAPRSRRSSGSGDSSSSDDEE